MRYEYIESTECQGNQTVLVDCEHGNQVFATYLVFSSFVSARVNKHQSLQGCITTSITIKHQVGHSISLLSLEIANSSSQILAGHGIQDKQPIFDAYLAQYDPFPCSFTVNGICKASSHGETRWLCNLLLFPESMLQRLHVVVFNAIPTNAWMSQIPSNIELQITATP